jgi:hypothetical protein
MIVSWRGENWHVEREPSAGDYWDWLMAVRQAIAAETQGIEDLHAIRRWLTSMTNKVMPTTPAIVPEDHLVALGEGILAACIGPVAAVEVRYRIDKVNLSKLPRPCECLRCQGLKSVDADCLFLKRQVSDHDRRISAEDPKTLALMWELPYSLYHLAITQDRCAMLASHATGDGEVKPVGRAGRSPEELKRAAKAALRGRR